MLRLVYPIDRLYPDVIERLELSDEERCMLSEPVVYLTCDTISCNSTEQLSLTTTARGGYDERTFKRQIEELGWEIDGDRHYCEGCKEDRKKGGEDEYEEYGENCPCCLDVADWDYVSG